MLWKRLLLATNLLFFLTTNAFCATEDFTTYTESDPDGDMTITTDRISVANDYNTGYANYDYGTDFFGDFEHLSTHRYGALANNKAVGYWTINDGETVYTEMDTNNNGILYYYTRGADGVYILDYTNDNSDGWTGHKNDTTHYTNIERSGTTCTVKLYSDSGRTTLEDTLSITCGNTSYDYLLMMMGLGGAGLTLGSACYIDSLDIQQASSCGADCVGDGVTFF